MRDEDRGGGSRSQPVWQAPNRGVDGRPAGTVATIVDEALKTDTRMWVETEAAAAVAAAGATGTVSHCTDSMTFQLHGVEVTSTRCGRGLHTCGGRGDDTRMWGSGSRHWPRQEPAMASAALLCLAGSASALPPNGRDSEHVFRRDCSVPPSTAQWACPGHVRACTLRPGQDDGWIDGSRLDGRIPAVAG